MNKPLDVIITKVYIGDKNKEGKPLLDKHGSPYKKVAIKTNVHGDKWLSALSFRDNDPIRDLTEGQSAKIIVEQDGEYLNFSLPSRVDILEGKVAELEQAIFGKKETAKDFEDKLEEEYPF